MRILQKTVTVRTSSLLAAFLLVPPLLGLIAWVFSWNAADGLYLNAVLVFQYMQLALFKLFVFLAIVFSLFSVVRGPKGGRTRKENVILLVLSVLVALIYLFFWL